MSKPRITLCANGQYRHVIYGLGPYIADYPEQALLACIVQNWCPKYVTHISLHWSDYLTLSLDAPLSLPVLMQ
jgi:hypothetical protein